MEETWKTSVRTDLAIEAREMVRENEEVEVPGVKVDVEENEEVQAKITRVEILNAEGAEIMHKPQGKYITIECPLMKENDLDAHEELTEMLTKEISSLKKVDKKATVLIVGLGNSNVTPDALGPKVISNLLVTRHLFQYVPDQIDDSISSVSAISPGVMGQTGVETSEIIQGIVKKVNPDLVIAIDALASRRTNRVNTTIQISDTGVHPGSGVGNRREGLNEETLGVPVIAIGVPTVVDAATLVNDTMDYLFDEVKKQNEKIKPFLLDMDTVDRYKLIKNILHPYLGQLFVTPKEVDDVVDRLAKMIGNALNLSIHEGLEEEDLARLVY